MPFWPTLRYLPLGLFQITSPPHEIVALKQHCPAQVWPLNLTALGVFVQAGGGSLVTCPGVTCSFSRQGHLRFLPSQFREFRVYGIKGSGIGLRLIRPGPAARVQARACTLLGPVFKACGLGFGVHSLVFRA